MAFEKICTKCKLEKPRSDFYDHPGGVFGKSSACKKCMRASGNKRMRELRQLKNKSK